MSTQVNVPDGPTNKQLIDRAYDMIGMSGEVFGRPNDEYTLGQRTLNEMMLEWPFNKMGYVAARYGDGDREEKSGISFEYQSGVSAELGVRLASAKGKALTPTQLRTLNSTSALIYSAFAVPEEMDFPEKTPAGNGAFYPFLYDND